MGKCLSCCKEVERIPYKDRESSIESRTQHIVNFGNCNNTGQDISMLTLINDEVILKNIESLFNEYRDENSELIEEYGLLRLLNDLSISPNDFAVFVLFYKFNATTACKLNKEVFINGCLKYGINSISSFRDKLSTFTYKAFPFELLSNQNNFLNYNYKSAESVSTHIEEIERIDPDKSTKQMHEIIPDMDNSNPSTGDFKIELNNMLECKSLNLKINSSEYGSHATRSFNTKTRFTNIRQSFDARNGIKRTNDFDNIRVSDIHTSDSFLASNIQSNINKLNLDYSINTNNDLGNSAVDKTLSKNKILGSNLATYKPLLNIEFNNIYHWSFKFALDQEITQKTLPLPVAIEMWRSLFTVSELFTDYVYFSKEAVYNEVSTGTNNISKSKEVNYKNKLKLSKEELTIINDESNILTKELVIDDDKLFIKKFNSDTEEKFEYKNLYKINICEPKPFSCGSRCCLVYKNACFNENSDTKYICNNIKTSKNIEINEDQNVKYHLHKEKQEDTSINKYNETTQTIYNKKNINATCKNDQSSTWPMRFIKSPFDDANSNIKESTIVPIKFGSLDHRKKVIPFAMMKYLPIEEENACKCHCNINNVKIIKRNELKVCQKCHDFDDDNETLNDGSCQCVCIDYNSAVVSQLLDLNIRPINITPINRLANIKVEKDVLYDSNNAKIKVTGLKSESDNKSSNNKYSFGKNEVDESHWSKIKQIGQLTIPPLVEKWLLFLDSGHAKIRGVTKDTWEMFLSFVEINNGSEQNLNNHDEAEAWPSLIDEFVDWWKSSSL